MGVLNHALQHLCQNSQVNGYKEWKMKGNPARVTVPLILSYLLSSANPRGKWPPKENLATELRLNKSKPRKSSAHSNVFLNIGLNNSNFLSIDKILLTDP